LHRQQVPVLSANGCSARATPTDQKIHSSMKLLPLLLITLLCGFASSASGTVAFYARPSLEYTKLYLDDDLTASAKLGGGISGGLALGDEQHYILELEFVSTTGVKADRIKDYVGYTTTLHETLDVNQFVFSFKYMILSKDSPVRIFVGPTAGWWTAEGTDRETTSRPGLDATSPVDYSVSESGFLFGPVAGLLFKINEHSSIDIAYRHIGMIGSDKNRSAYYSGFTGHLAKQLCVGFRYLF
jgi:hypothetical protein